MRPNGWVIDAGAHKQEFSWRCVSRYNSRVVAIEANGAIEPIKRGPSVKWEKAAIADRDGVAHFLISENLEASYLSSESPPSSLNDASISYGDEVHCLTLKSVMEQNDIDIVDVLKLDVEGSEFQVISSLTSEIASRIKQITVEFHPPFPSDSEVESIEAAIENLSGFGFQCVKCTWSGWGDTLFINKLYSGIPSPATCALLPFYRKMMKS
jgi:FkbM family methyltransferase